LPETLGAVAQKEISKRQIAPIWIANEGAEDGKNYREKREVLTGIFTVFFGPTRQSPGTYADA